jgi:FkbM family methyltransferase
MTNRARVQKFLCEKFNIKVPYIQLGAVDSLDLMLNFNELLIFEFYQRKRYKKVADIGANIGIHSWFMAQQGWNVTAYEPDPLHCSILYEAPGITAKQLAVSDHDGVVDFVRVLGNTTSSHIRGSKVPYGDVETFRVPCVDIRSFDYDFMKIDVEGHEADLLLRLSEEQLSQTEIICEVGNARNAAVIFDHFQKIGFPIRTQLKGWAIASRIEDMPTNHREGSIFIGGEF